MLTVEWDGGASTIRGFRMDNLRVQNIVDRANGAGELIYLDKMVGGGMNHTQFISSEITVGSRVRRHCDMVKMVAPFEVTMKDVLAWGNDVAFDIISGPQSDGVRFENFTGLYNSITIVGFRGAGGSGTNNFYFSGKILGWQGGSFVTSNLNARARGTVVSTLGRTVTLGVGEGAKVKVDRGVLLGATNDGVIANDMSLAIVTDVTGDVITLDRDITTVAGAKFLSGMLGYIGSECRQPEFKNFQVEGLDYAFIFTRGSTLINLAQCSAGNTATTVYLSCRFRNISIKHVVNTSTGTLENGNDWELITVDDNIETSTNRIELVGSGFEGGDLNQNKDYLQYVTNLTTGTTV